MRALEFPAGGSCSVWFIPVYSCLLCVAGDLTGRRAYWRGRAGGRARARVHRHLGTQAVYDSSPSLSHTHAHVHARALSKEMRAEAKRVLRWQEAEVEQGRI